MKEREEAEASMNETKRNETTSTDRSQSKFQSIKTREKQTSERERKVHSEIILLYETMTGGRRVLQSIAKEGEKEWWSVAGVRER